MLAEISKRQLTSLRLVTLLSPVLYETYRYIADYLGEHLAISSSLYASTELTCFARGETEIGLLCGLLYVHLQRDTPCPVELLAAPVLHGERYRDTACYFSDIIVQQTSSYASFEDLRGCTWAYNECASHSGYNVVLSGLLQRGLRLDYFGETIETGSHLQSLHAVLQGKADATALDSHVLDTLRQQRPELVEQLRIVETFGPSPAPPLVVAQGLEPALKARIRECLLTMHHDPQAVHELSKGCIKRFVHVVDADYDTLRNMFAQVQSW